MAPPDRRARPARPHGPRGADARARGGSPGPRVRRASTRPPAARGRAGTGSGSFGISPDGASQYPLVQRREQIGVEGRPERPLDLSSGHAHHVAQRGQIEHIAHVRRLAHHVACGLGQGMERLAQQVDHVVGEALGVDRLLVHVQTPDTRSMRSSPRSARSWRKRRRKNGLPAVFLWQRSASPRAELAGTRRPSFTRASVSSRVSGPSLSERLGTSRASRSRGPFGARAPRRPRCAGRRPKKSTWPSVGSAASSTRASRLGRSAHCRIVEEQDEGMGGVGEGAHEATQRVEQPLPRLGGRGLGDRRLGPEQGLQLGHQVAEQRAVRRDGLAQPLSPARPRGLVRPRGSRGASPGTPR